MQKQIDNLLWEDPNNDLNAFRKLAQSSLVHRYPDMILVQLILFPCSNTWPEVIGTYFIDHGNQ